MQGVMSCECEGVCGHEYACNSIATIQYRTTDGLWFPTCLPCFAKYVNLAMIQQNSEVVEKAIRALGLDETT